ncbi:MAG: AAA family ATPase [Piscirickettsiaceae bacterium CG_4_10_14_3_um_filter_44_349]|nr:AAA family ATPase [Thiomicrospira sp.]OIP95351.1 MAG: hypothetical protein AUK56_05920 [Thiomicrospira sp. CG2_30_44_34]PIU38984.1 MAG: AAA family ATPase [Piscirickettsiaceae bacterium CG07_land_8_20_14_0_80_44_28]PIW78360.1 MAG: AAA family ATPase [Piscirickettsiaceae bacterium CG_4_8_14_3_um_filter_44_38]PIX80948.1 MAG: AAA family ATPase [Piscirickettsiaceae bacterium CG_4_10_14_3_um_filter_44_349]PIZ75867.1 MAG: AAA family ATPase [Piscirickettsiaceae bacterium CG_4_10_14_0_2_um_filter_44_
MANEIELNTLEDIKLLKESCSLECKLATGKDGKGNLPNDFWETYSAMANTYGGIVLLGIQEKKGQFSLVGLENIDTVKAQLVNGANNPQIVSANLLKDEHIETISIECIQFLKVIIPEATRKDRPVYLKQTPIKNSYRRLNESDQKMSDEEVKRALAEQMNDSRDNEILIGYGLTDLHEKTLQDYRQTFAVRQPTHPFNKLDDLAFLERIGAWRRDREKDIAGLTIAGLLMFAEDHTIQDILPNYQLDYQERPQAKTENRWSDRVTLDGTWSGNLFDFFHIVYRKLTTEIKVPFQLEGGIRKEDTPLHIAVREALCNVLVHADYTGRASVLVVKRPDMFGFRNPGLMRVPVSVAIHGGEADCRNRLIHKMFRFVGIGEQSGSGLPKIFDSWKAYHWKKPMLEEVIKPNEQTLLKLWMTDLLPQGSMSLLARHFGTEFGQVSNLAQLALGIAFNEKTVTHERLCSLSTEHSADVSKTLNMLVEKGWLKQTGHSRGSVYHLTTLDSMIPKADDVFNESNTLGSNSNTLGLSSNTLGSNSNTLGLSSNTLGSNSNTLGSENRDEFGRLISPSEYHRFPFIDELTLLTEPTLIKLHEIAKEPRTKKRVSSDVMEAVLLNLCKNQYVSISVLSELVERTPDLLRKSYLSNMVKTKKLELAFPTEISSPKQAYIYIVKEKNMTELTI